ncbi:unnamed protein product, partial [marine sediment metagenome]
MNNFNYLFIKLVLVSDMIPEERRIRILEILKNNQFYKTEDLTKELKVSRVTIQE